MIRFTYIQGIIPITEIWYSNNVSMISSFIPITYANTNSNKEYIGFKKSEFFTKVIDLSQSEDTLKAETDKDTQYDVRRSIKDGVIFEASNDWNNFIVFYNKFAASKGLSPINKKRIDKIKNNAVIMSAKKEDEILVMHVYLIDPISGYSRLLYSSSQFRGNNDSTYRALIGRANRYLHWHSILYFKSIGFKFYDLGGYSRDSTDSVLQGINKFKDSFGGKYTTYSTYSSFTLVFMQKISAIIKTLYLGANH